MATQDFTTYTKVDPGSKLTVTATRITFTAMPQNASTYVYKDLGAGAVGGSFKHRFNFNITSGSNNNVAGLWLVANTIANDNAIMGGSFNALEVSIFIGATGVLNLFLRERWNNAGTWTTSSTSTAAVAFATTYYVTVVRDESVGTYGTLYLYVYSDSGRTTLVATLTRTLNEAVDFQYVYDVSSSNTGSGNTSTGYVDTFDMDMVNLPAASVVATNLPVPTYPAIVVPSTFVMPVMMDDPYINVVLITPSSFNIAAVLPVATVPLPVIVMLSEAVGATLVLFDPDVLGKNVLITVSNFPQGASVLYKIVDGDTGILAQDWTSVGVTEAQGVSKSTYYAKTTILNQDTQAIVCWKTSDGTYEASESFNIYDSYMIHVRAMTNIIPEINETVLATQTALTSHEAARASMQTALVAEHDATQGMVDNLPLLAEIEASSILARQSTLDAIYDIVILLKKYVRNKKKIITTSGAKYLVIYDDNGTTQLVNKALKDKDGNDISDLVAGVLAWEDVSSV